jgi:hypothetical protein
VVHDKVYVVPFVCVVHVDSIPFFNTARKAERPFIPRLKPGAFWPHFCKAPRDHGGGKMPALYFPRRVIPRMPPRQ